jgi:DNA-binding FrmR family transcriptional regulator
MSHTLKQKQDFLVRAKRMQSQVEALLRAGLMKGAIALEVLQVMSAAPGAMNSLMSQLLEHISVTTSEIQSRNPPASNEAADEVIGMVKSHLK